MDPIGFSLENFDAIGLWRTHDEGKPINPAISCSTTPRSRSGRFAPVAGDELRRTSSSTVATEKLMTYALGRGVERRDMPLVRAIARDVIKNNGRFSSMVLGIVTSQPFQMNMRVEAVPGTTTARRRTAPTERESN